MLPKTIVVAHNCSSKALWHTTAHMPPQEENSWSNGSPDVASSENETAVSSEIEIKVLPDKPFQYTQIKSNDNAIVSNFVTPRPKRASATAARFFLQEIFHSTFGNVEEGVWAPGSSDENPKTAGRRPRSTKQIIEIGSSRISNKLNSVSPPTIKGDQVDCSRPQCKRRKRQRKDSDNEQPKKKPINSDEKVLPKRGSKLESDEDRFDAAEIDDDFLKFMDEFSNGCQTGSDAFAHFVNNDIFGGSKISSQRCKAPQQRKNRCMESSYVADSHLKKIGDIPQKNCEKETSEIKECDQKKTVNPEILTAGSRVLIKCTEDLHQATTKKTRLRQESYDYLVHCNGSKKLMKEIRSSIPGSSINFDDINADKAMDNEEKRFATKKATKTSNCRQQKRSPGRPRKTETKFFKGSEVYVEYKSVLYLATILDTKQKKEVTEYFMHYDGFKKSADRWVQESQLREINAITTRIFKKFRNEMKGGRKTGEGPEEETPSSQKQTREYNLCDINPGVAFLPGSCIFVEWNDALYLAQMLKRRYRAGETEYFVHYNGHAVKWDSWVALSTVYEINPKTRRIFEKERKDVPPGIVQEIITDPPKQKKTRKEKPAKMKDKPSCVTMGYIESGVQFLSGSTLFSHVNNGLYLAKMLKKRGSGGEMEYLIQYDGYNRNAETWAPVSALYEINPQTKLVFKKQKMKHSPKKLAIEIPP